MNTVPFVQMTFATLANHSVRLVDFLQVQAWQARTVGNYVLFESLQQEITVINNQARYLQALHEQGVSQLPINGLTAGKFVHSV